MDITNMSQLISSIGFPIAAYIGLFWYIIKQDTNHKEEISKISDTVDNNTLAIVKLVEHLEANK